MADNRTEQEVIFKLSTEADTSGVDKFNQKLTDTAKIDVAKPIKTLKQELKEAQNAAQKIFQEFGSGSKEFLEAGKRVQSLKNDIDEVNLSIQNFQPDNRLQPLVSVAKAGTAAIQGVAGALAVVGVESDTAAQTIARLQGLMAFSDSLNSLGDLKDSFKNINSLIQNSTVFQKANNAVTAIASTVMKAFGVSVTQTSTAFKVLRGAIMATGIGLLIVGVTALISKISEWTSSTDEQEEAQQRLNSALEAQKNLLDGNLAGIDFVTKALVARAKIAGASEAELTKIQNAGAADRIKELKNNYETLNALARDGSKRSVEDQQKANDAQKAAFKSYIDALQAEELRGLENQADAAEKGRQQAKSNADKSKALRDKELAELKSHQEQVNAINRASLEALALRGKSEKDAELYRIGVEYKNNLKTIQDTQAEELKLLGKTEQQKAAIKAKYKDAANNSLQVYLNQQFDIEKKYQDLINSAIEENLRATQDKYITAREDINKEIDALLKNATESQAKALETLRSSRLSDAARNENLETISVRAETKLINTEVNSTINEGDTPAQRRSKIEALAQAQIDAENAAYELKREQNKAQKEELERLEAEHNARLVGINRDASEQKKAIDESEFEAKKQILDATGNILGQASQLLGQQTLAGKATAIAQTTIATYQSAQDAYKSLVGIPVLGPGLAAAAAAVAVAGGLANVKKIASTKVPSVAGGGTNAAPSISAPNVTAPSINAASVLNGVMVIQFKM